MKKLILLLLISGGLSAQVVVPRSTTTFSNVNAVGSMTVGGNLRVTGSQTFTGASTLSNSTTIGTGTVAANTSSLGIVRIKQGSSWIDLGEVTSGSSSLWLDVTPAVNNFILRNYLSGSTILNGSATHIAVSGSIRSSFYNTYNVHDRATRIGSAVAPSATLDVTGTFSLSNQSFSVGTTALTGGNTGTVAVLSDAVFPVTFNSTSSNPADATTYYFGISGYQLTATATNSITLPYNCTLVGWDLNAVVSGASGTTEAATLAINGTTNYTLSSSITYSTAYTNVNTTGLSQNFSANDKINIKLVCPTWATNPTAIFQGVTLWFVRRQ